ncbi:LON peptidase substrate-binding domain-containing protein [Insolitispirillum peregrinum]|uniref:Lon N-terminal domain-containing protein n=1 Tax=Insolitispirillum peregrinum TaxID=80876 RepID=A0A1N7JCW7_9PROT|nr:LON peptidase substrate-binding domain-containing protein [Insolitispirillum peregrinum]SIS47145.1 hypothetical protein SAMN05421779_102114 [Insolitispirillum peregrinum]
MVLPGPFHPRFDALPRTLPVFPLPGALLLPWGKLPLNIFEPRYLNMVEDALGAGRLIGMIQPLRAQQSPGEDRLPLCEVGCAGRISSFTESNDGRLLITLTGLIRFRVTGEVPGQRGYRVISPQWGAFADDLAPPPAVKLDRKRLLLSMSGFVQQRELPMNLRILEDLKDPDLITTLAMICPFDVQEKQAILEAETLQDRADLLQTLLDMAHYASGNEPQSRQ